MTAGTVTDLISRAQQGDRDASETLVRENTGLIWSVSKRFLGRGVDADDIFQLGSIGFLKAVMGFDTAYGTQFSTYAVPKISGEIRRFLRDDGTVKVSRGLKERAALVRAARIKLAQSQGAEPTLSQIACETGLTPEEIAQAETAVSPAQSLQYEAGEDGFTLEAVLGTEGIEEKILERIALTEAVKMLPEKERMTIALRFGRHLTQEQSARILGVSQVQVSRLERRAIDKLRTML